MFEERLARQAVRLATGVAGQRHEAQRRELIDRCANRFHPTIGGPQLRMQRLR
jgi:hypothetical protein